MLVLSRKTGQEVVIGDNIRITINNVSGNRVSVGISAPGHVAILRGELERTPPRVSSMTMTYNDVVTCTADAV
jgi:carbon storage regulator CsrA